LSYLENNELWIKNKLVFFNKNVKYFQMTFIICSRNRENVETISAKCAKTTWPLLATFWMSLEAFRDAIMYLYCEWLMPVQWMSGVQLHNSSIIHFVSVKYRIYMILQERRGFFFVKSFVWCTSACSSFSILNHLHPHIKNYQTRNW